MTSLLSHIIGNDHFILSGERALYWETEKTLIVADLHVGKTGHFRKSGIAVPAAVYKDDLHRLLAQLLFFKAERLIIVGDLTHSIANLELDLFRKWRKDFHSLDVHLAKGNHDILDDKWYEEAAIRVHNDPFQINSFFFVHDINQQPLVLEPHQYAFAGHVHPAVTIRGKGKQSLRFPCFHFAKNYCILPAFSKFTGTYSVEKKKGEFIYALLENEIMPM